MSARIAHYRKRLPVRIAALFLGSLLIFMTAALSARAAPPAELWARWTAHDKGSVMTIDHAAWGAFLGKYVRTGARGVNLVRYGTVTTEDRRNLDGYIAHLSLAPISTYSRRVQLAYWINLYNALTIQTVLRHFPVDSIRDIDISPGWFASGPWGRKQVEVEGVALSLDDIEHRILRPIWRDPRIHYAVNCASVGCPNLQRAPYTGENVERMLTFAAREYINNWRGVTFEDGDLYISEIYKWYATDFGDSHWAIIAHLRKYAMPKLREMLGRVEGIEGYRYDWSINAEPFSG